MVMKMRHTQLSAVNKSPCAMSSHVRHHYQLMYRWDINPSLLAMLPLLMDCGPPEHLFPNGFTLITDPVFTG